MLNIKNSCRERFAPVVESLEKLVQGDEKKGIIVALDGKCASGKSTLGFYLQELFDANLFHMDDFFLQTHQRTQERLAEVGGNVDYERFKEEVLVPTLAGETVHYRRFDCKSMSIAEQVEVTHKSITVIEGSYCMHPYFGDVYDLKVFTEIGETEQLENIRMRNGEEKLSVFQERWIPKEEAYFKKFQVKEKCDLVVEWRKNR